MANYESKFRSNYFKVQEGFNKESIEKLFRLFGLECGEKNGMFCFYSDDTPSASIYTPSNMSRLVKMLPAYASRLGAELVNTEEYEEDDLLDDEIPIFDIFEFFVLPGETVVVVEVGSEKMRYLASYCAAYDSDGVRIEYCDPIEYVMCELEKRNIKTTDPTY